MFPTIKHFIIRESHRDYKRGPQRKQLPIKRTFIFGTKYKMPKAFTEE